MFKIKSHNRFRSQDNILKKDLKLTVQKNEKENNQNFNKKLKNQSKNFIQKGPPLIKLNQSHHFRQIYSYRNSVEHSQSQSYRFKFQQKTTNRLDLQKQKKCIQKNRFQLSQICKQKYQEQNKKKILEKLIELIKLQIQEEQTKIKKTQPNKNLEAFKQQIKKVVNKIQKFSDLNNQKVDENKKFLNQINKERKNRILYESYFVHLQKQLKKCFNEYNALLLKSQQNKLFLLMIPSKDVVTNGHIVTLKIQSNQKLERNLYKNSYMCLPKINSFQQENQIRRKSQKYIGKNGTFRKLNKILNFLQSSKALESGQLSLYQQQDQIQKKNSRTFSIFKTQRQVGVESHSDKIQNPVSILRKKYSKKIKPRSGKIVSIKFINNINEYYENSFNEITFELFRFYQSLGINIFAKVSQKQFQTCEKQDFFQYDQSLLVSQSQRRLQFIDKNIQKIKKFNQTYEKKSILIQKNIVQTSTFIDQLQKKKKNWKQKQKIVQEELQAQIQQKYEQDKHIYMKISKKLGISYQNYDSQQEIENLIQKLNECQRNIQIQNQNQNFEVSNKTISQKQYNLQNLMSIIKPQNKKYIKQMSKTEGCQRKFHQIIMNDDEKSSKNSKMNMSCRSIYQNGMKSLDNIFGNMKICNSYQRAFQRKQFEKQYDKEITKKKKVMFRREARILPTIQ